MGREAKINKKLTRKQTVFVKELVSGKSATQAAMTAYDVDNTKTASVIASQNLNKLSIREALEEALSSNGLSLSIITSNLGNIANSKPEKISGDTVLKANVELLKLHNAYPSKVGHQTNYIANKMEWIESLSIDDAKKELEELRSRNDKMRELMD